MATKRHQKYPEIEVTERGIFDRIIAAATKWRADARNRDSVMYGLSEEDRQSLQRLKERETRNATPKDD